MKPTRVVIDQLRVRASGLSRAEAQRLGESIATQLNTETFDGTLVGRVASLTIRSPQASTSTDRLAVQVADAIRRRLK
jgi:hypothetical protein